MSTFVKDILGGYKNIKMLSVEILMIVAQMAESVDALVSNTSGVTSIPVRPRVWVQEKELSICKSNI